MYDYITGIILAGGKSTRMGQNKSLLEFKGKTVIENAVSMITSIFQRVIIITNSPADYRQFGLGIFADFYEGRGPLAGIHAGLTYSKTERNFIVSCDIPLVTEQAIEFVCGHKTKQPMVFIRADGFVQHLCGIYERRLLPQVEAMLKDAQKTDSQKECSIHALIDAAGSEVIESSEIPGYFEGMFLNLNRPEDYEKLLSMSKR